jgi:hypothetical protein
LAVQQRRKNVTRGLPVIERAGEHHRPEWRADLTMLHNFERFVATSFHRGFILSDRPGIGILTIHEMRVLAELHAR